MKKSFTHYSLLFAFVTQLFLSAGTAKAQFFAKGADVGWLSQMEASGKVFYNNAGVQQDCIQILAGKGINSIRLRVWVNPTAYWSGLPDVVTQAIRAKNAGMKVMIDLHYSDYWADPGTQTKPAAWTGLVFDSLVATLNRYTRHVMDTLLAKNVVPDWVQVGNETNNGMLWEDGKASVSMNRFARLVTAGYTAVKAASPATKVIVHLSNGYDNSLFRWMFDGLTANSAQWDVIGMSLYPTTANWQTLTSQCLTNMNDMITRYNKEVMISEIGLDVVPAPTGKRLYADMLAKVRSLPNNKGLGVFIWEPEAYGSWQGYNKTAFDMYGKPTVAMDAFLEDNAGAPGVNLLTNPSFEAGNTGTATPAGWSKSGATAASYTSSGGGWNADGNYFLNHYQSTAYQVRTFQTVTVPNGNYQLTAWIARSTGQNICQVYATGFGGADINTNIPYNNVWSQVTIPNITVTNGQLTIGFYSDANAGNWMDIDSVRLINTASGLPVKLLAYDAVLQPNKTVKLTWRSTAEINNKQFVIQRSGDGNIFTDIVTIATRSASSENEYVFIDNHPLLQNFNYYRLVQVDKDGKSTVLGTRVIRVAGGKTEASIYPNPANHSLSIKQSTFTGKPIIVRLIGVDGKQVFSQQLTPISEQFTIDLPSIAKGQYMLQISASGVAEHHKVFIK